MDIHRLTPLAAAGCVLAWAVFKADDGLSLPTRLHGGLAPDEASSEQVDRVGHFLAFDRGALGFQVEIPDPVGAESRAPPLLADGAANGDLVLPARGWRWRFLSSSKRREIREVLRARGGSHGWRRLVVHGSGSEMGNARVVRAHHERRRPGLDCGVYHFVIGNGSYSGDGEVELGVRWRQQRPSAAMRVQELNAESLSVCLIGTFQETGPTRAQWLALDELLAYLRAQLGSIALRSHRGIESTAASCPGPGLEAAHLIQLSERS